MGEYTSLSIQVYGLAILISFLVAVMIRIVVKTLSTMKKKPAAPAVEPAVPVAVDDTKDHIAAIAAAVYAMSGVHRIVHIEPTRRGAVWTAEGRLAHHASHNVPHRPKR